MTSEDQLHNRRPPLFITLEGMDGVGKTTQATLLVDALEASGYEVIRVREPGGTAVGERVRAVLLDREVTRMDPMCELLLFEAARAQIVAEVIRPALERGAVVVSDRFVDSTMAYQGHARGLDVEAVGLASRMATDGLLPTRTVVLSLDVEEAYGRATAGEAGADRMEADGMAFQADVQRGFIAIAQADPDRVHVIDAVGDAAEVAGRIRADLADLVDWGTC